MYKSRMYNITSILRSFLCPFAVNPLPLQVNCDLILNLHKLILTILRLYKNKISQDVLFCTDFFLSTSNLWEPSSCRHLQFARFLLPNHITVCENTIICSSLSIIDRHLNGFQFRAIVNKAMVNIIISIS